MNIQVLEDRSVIKMTCEKNGTQNENYATTLNFEFPEYVEKDGERISTLELNKYIVFDIEGEENTDLILDNKYVLKSNITKNKDVRACIYLKEPSLNDDMTDKLIWITKMFILSFNSSIEENVEMTPQKIDAFNTLYTELNLKIIEVNSLTEYIEQFKRDVEAGLYNGQDGKTPEKGIDYMTEQDIEEMEQNVLNALINSDEFDILILE